MQRCLRRVSSANYSPIVRSAQAVRREAFEELWKSSGGIYKLKRAFRKFSIKPTTADPQQTFNFIAIFKVSSIMERPSHSGRLRQASSLIFPIKVGGFATAYWCIFCGVLISNSRHADHNSSVWWSRASGLDGFWGLAVWGSQVQERRVVAERHHPW